MAVKLQILCVAIMALLIANIEAAYSRHLTNDVLKGNADYGTVENCDKSLSEFAVKYSPKKILYNQNVTVSGYIIPNADLDEGYLCVKVSVDGIEGPLYNNCTHVDCSDVHKVFPFFCPFKKGVKVEVKNYVQLVNPPFQITPGTYHVEGRLYTGDGRHKPVVCAKADVIIDEDYTDYPYYNY